MRDDGPRPTPSKAHWAMLELCRIEQRNGTRLDAMEFPGLAKWAVQAQRQRLMRRAVYGQVASWELN